jgi:putative transposase
MGKKRHTPEEIVAKLRQVDVLVAQGTPVADAIRAIGVTEVTYYRWRQAHLKQCGTDFGVFSRVSP